MESEVLYSFTSADGETAEGRHEASHQELGSLAVGDSVRVVYDPARPATSYMLTGAGKVKGGLRSAWTVGLYSAVGAVLAGGSALWLWGVLIPPSPEVAPAAGGRGRGRGDGDPGRSRRPSAGACAGSTTATQITKAWRATA